MKTPVVVDVSALIVLEKIGRLELLPPLTDYRDEAVHLLLIGPYQEEHRLLALHTQSSV